MSCVGQCRIFNFIMWCHHVVMRGNCIFWVWLLQQMFIHSINPPPIQILADTATYSVPVSSCLGSGCVCVFTLVSCPLLLPCNPLFRNILRVYVPLSFLSSFCPSPLPLCASLLHTELSQIIPLLPGGRRLTLTMTVTVWPGRRMRRRCCCGRTSATTTPPAPWPAVVRETPKTQ